MTSQTEQALLRLRAGPDQRTAKWCTTSGTTRSQHQPFTPPGKTDRSQANGWDEYANWHLGIDDEASEHTKARYKYPYGDFSQVHRCGVLAAEVRAGRNKHADIENATIHLRDMIDELDR